MSQAGADGESLLVHGSLLVGYAQACRNLNIVVGGDVLRRMHDLEVNRWYPLRDWNTMERLVIRHYFDVDPILVKVGMEMMTGWYHHGPGRSLIGGGLDFLHFQTGGGGFRSVVKGPPDSVGTFELARFEPERGRATVHSTTPFNRKMECGVLIGGMLAPGDIDYVDVINDNDSDLLEVEFH
ncbi:MAG: hypothetical protein KDK70_25320 [Myxococcales bacterium]|nr:hypothetical protein [Myxococcales bacterium]